MKRRILIVDDEPGMLRAVRRVLEGIYEVTSVATPDEALSTLEGFAPDLAILDVRMPGTDGFELMARLKERQADLDFILMTGSFADIDEKLVRSIRERAFYFIQKPFDRQVLLTLVERCLELRRLAEANRRHVESLEAVLAEARAFQTSLLPATQAELGGLRVAARFRSCDDLCGDLYDYAPLAAGGVAFMIADVSGHGAAAAMLTAAVKSAFQSCAPEQFHPELIVRRIATGIRGFKANRFVSLICGTWDPGSDRLDYVNAGHPPALLWRTGGPIRTLDPTGPIVSPALSDAVFHGAGVAIERGQRLLLYTDGVTETSGADGEFGTERLHALAAADTHGGALLLDAILREIERHSDDRPPRDDLTLLTLDPR